MVRTFIQAIGGPDQPILVVPLMRERADEAGRQSADFLREHGAKNVDVFLEVEYRPLDQAATRARFLRAKGLWLPGGDQGLFMQRLGSTCSCKGWARVSPKTSFNWPTAGGFRCSAPVQGPC